MPEDAIRPFSDGAMLKKKVVIIIQFRRKGTNVMSKYMRWLVVGLLMIGALTACAETFVLADGTEVEGTMIRARDSRVTIRTSKGISSYSVSEFDEDTRLAHFPELELEPLVQPEPPRTRAQKQPSQDSAATEGASVLALVLVIGGSLLMFVGSLWFIVAGFAESPAWGIALLLFNGIAGLPFLLLCWDRAKAPVFAWLIGLGLVLSAIYFV